METFFHNGLKIVEDPASKRDAAVERARQNSKHGDEIFDNPEALIELAQSSFKKAAQVALAENDRAGIPTPGCSRGKLVVRNPAKQGNVLDHS